MKNQIKDQSRLEWDWLHQWGHRNAHLFSGKLGAKNRGIPACPFSCTNNKLKNPWNGSDEGFLNLTHTVESDLRFLQLRKVTVNGTAYHKGCFKCTHGGCTISPSNYIAHEGKLYCKHHHIQLFKEKGNYSQLENEKTPEVTKAIIPTEVAAES